MSDSTHEPRQGSSGPTVPPPAGTTMLAAPTMPHLTDHAAPASPPLPTLPPRPVQRTEHRPAAELALAPPAPSPAPPPAPPLAATVPTPASLQLPVVSMVGPGVAFVAGRVLMMFAISLVVGGAWIAIRNPGADQARGFWLTVCVAALIALAGLVGVAWWAASLSDNARSLRMRTYRFGTMLACWTVPLAWAAVASTTLMRIEVSAEVDPMPGIAAIGLAVALGVPYGATHQALRRLRRGRANVAWWFLYAVDLWTFGLTWYLLSDWPSEAPGWESFGGQGRLLLTGGGVLWMLLAALASIGLATAGPSLVRQRQSRLDGLDAGDGKGPQWFQSGLARRAIPASDVHNSIDTGDTTGAVDRRPIKVDGGRSLLNATPARYLSFAAHILWGGALGFSIVAYLLAVVRTEFALLPAEFARSYWERLDVVVMLALGACLVAHGVWMMFALGNVRRVSVHGQAPNGLMVLALPFPICGALALVLWKTVGVDDALAALTAGTFFGFVCYLISIQCLRTSLVSVRGSSRKLRVWFGVFAIVVTGRGVERLALRYLGDGKLQYMMLGVIWLIGALLVVGGAVFAYRAMADFERQLVERRNPAPTAV